LGSQVEGIEEASISSIELPSLEEKEEQGEELSKEMPSSSEDSEEAAAGEGEGEDTEDTEDRNLGNHLAKARAEGNEDALERRFTALLSAHPDDLPDYLRQTISILKSKEIPINWNQLFSDVQWWSHPDYGDRVKKRWATAFWGTRQSSLEEDEE
jgi:hypothetical protein